MVLQSDLDNALFVVCFLKFVIEDVTFFEKNLGDFFFSDWKRELQQCGGLL